MECERPYWGSSWAHIQKHVRTWGVINSVFMQEIGGVEFRLLLARCGDIWGMDGSPAIYSASIMSDSCILPHGDTYLDIFA